MEQSACPTDHLFALGQEGLPAWKRPERLGSADLDRGDKVRFGRDGDGDPPYFRSFEVNNSDRPARREPHLTAD